MVHFERLNDSQPTETVMAMAERLDRDAFPRQQGGGTNRPDSHRDLGLIHCPTLVPCGRRDIRTPLAVSEEMAEKIPRASPVVVEDCDHLAPLEPRAVSTAFRDGLSF